MRLSNKEIVTILKEACSAMEVKNYNFFKVRAYQNAISILDNLTTSIYDMWENQRLGEIPGIGTNLQQHLDDLFTKGKVADFDQAKHGLPDGMFALIGLRGIGAKKAFKLATAFNLTERETAIEKIKEKAEKNEIQELEGFGAKSESDILEAINQLKMTKNEKQRMLLYKAEEIVDRVLAHMKTLPEVLEIEATGSFRRRNPTIGDLDFVVATVAPEKVLEHFLTFPEIAEILVKGDKKVSVVLSNDAQVDVRVSDPKAFGAMLQYSTGSKQHNIVLRQFALEKKMSLSEYGIKIVGSDSAEPLQFATEKDFYGHLGLEYIAPELRQGNGEVEAARDDKLPHLIKLGDIKGDIQSHTTASDGLNTLGEMVKMADSLGYEYYGVSDHAPSVLTRGEEEVKEIILKTRKQINALNEAQRKVKVLFGYEVNILADETLGLPDEYLEMLDYVIASIHTAFNQDRETMTRRIIKALENPFVNVLGHPSGRLINQREGIDVDWNKVFDCAKANGKIIEINAQPNRLDISDDLVREALRKNVKLMINTDAHETTQLGMMGYGIDVARRGWCEKKDIINTLGFNDFCKALGVRNW